MWQRMSQLFGHRWSSQEGDVRTPRGDYSPRFLLWCRKTESLSEDDWRRGFAVVEQRVREAARQGDTEWPPTYGEFLGYCMPPVKPRGHRYFDQSRAIEDQEAKKRRYEAGRKHCSELLKMFDEGEEKCKQ